MTRRTTQMEVKRMRKTERNMAICSDRAAGLYYHQIAKKYGISIIRVRQILEVWNDRQPVIN